MTAVLLSGCLLPPLPDFSAEVSVYARTDQNNKTNEVVRAIVSNTIWSQPFLPDSARWATASVRRYYFSNRYVRRKPLPFLGGNDTGRWETLAPVEGTNCWVRLGLAEKPYGSTSNLVVTVFTPGRLLYQQNIETNDRFATNCLRFVDGNRVITYKSENDQFVYNVLENNLSTQSVR